jgi:hypothetical protein
MIDCVRTLSPGVGENALPVRAGTRADNEYKLERTLSRACEFHTYLVASGTLPTTHLR